MNNSGTINNTWLKLAGVLIVGIILIFVTLWAINVFNGNSGFFNRYGYQNQMFRTQTNSQNGNMQMDPQYGNMQMGPQNGNMQMGSQNGMNQNGNMNGPSQGNTQNQGGMGMMSGMGMH